MILFKLLFAVLPVAFALTGQTVTFEGCQSILTEFPAQREICFTQLARSTGDRMYCTYVPSDEGAARCEAFILSLKRPSWTALIDNGWLIYTTVFLVVNVLVNTLRREFLFGLIVGAALYLFLHFIRVYIPDTTWLPTVKEYVDIPPRSILENAPNFFKQQHTFVKELIAYTLTYGQFVGLVFGYTFKRILVAIVFMALCIGITLYGTEAYQYITTLLS